MTDDVNKPFCQRCGCETRPEQMVGVYCRPCIDAINKERGITQPHSEGLPLEGVPKRVIKDEDRNYTPKKKSKTGKISLNEYLGIGAGRPSKVEDEDDEEESVEHDEVKPMTIKCSKCGKPGHNAKTCGKVKDDKPVRKYEKPTPVIKAGDLDNELELMAGIMASFKQLSEAGQAFIRGKLQ
jgi:hypothetical protein